MYALVDANNMYCSCERVFQPHLQTRPLVVLSSNDGACIARSNEAKELGVKMAQPWFQVQHLEKTHGLVAMSANFELYGDMSARMMTIAARYSPDVEVYSIDEAFIGLDGVRGDLVAIGRDLRAAVLRETGLPTSVGIAKTKTLAKLANHVAKTADRKPGSYPAHLAQVCNFSQVFPAELDAVMAATDVGAVWGVGRKISTKLVEGGIVSVLDLVRTDAATLRKRFSVVLEKTLLELRGTPCLNINDAPASRQQILVSRSFGHAITDADGLVEAITEFTSRAAEKLRAQGSLAGAVVPFFLTSPFRANDRQHSVSVTVPLVRPTSDTRVLASAAAAVARREFRPGFNYAKAGVMLLDLMPIGQTQRGGTGPDQDLFSEMTDPSQRALPGGGKSSPALMEAMDVLNHRYGRNAVRLGSTVVASLGAPIASWATRQERRSQRFTTRWEEMPVVRA